MHPTPVVRKLLLTSDFSNSELSEFESDLTKTLATKKTHEVPYTVFSGHGVAPTALLRTGLFTDVKVNEQSRVFEVLGMKNTQVRRDGRALRQTHLAVLVYLLGKVKNWTCEGKTVCFSAWDAVRALGWGANSKTVEKLKTTLEDLQKTIILLVHDSENQTEESAPLVGRLLTSLDKGKRVAWEVQLTATFVEAVAKHRTFLELNTLAALPPGTTTWLYGFIASETSRESEWDLDALAERAGLTMPYDRVAKSGEMPTAKQALTRKNENRRKLRESLEVLVKGEVVVTQRGLSIYLEGRSEMVERPIPGTGKTALVARSTAKKIKYFEPPIASWSFRTTKDGKTRVRLVKSTKAQSKKLTDK